MCSSDLHQSHPHDVHVFDGEEVRCTFPASGSVARCSVSRSSGRFLACFGEDSGVEIFVPVYGDVVGLPEEEEGTLLVVSALVRTHPSCAGRGDLLSPADLVRQGNLVVGCRSFDANR